MNTSVTTTLEALGWNDYFEQHFAALPANGFEPGRVAVENRGSYLVYTPAGEYPAEASGRLLFTAESPADLPRVGDWVALTAFEGQGQAIIHHVLPRRSKFSRRAATKQTQEQIVATNVDTVFIVQGLDGNFNPRRLERYLVMAYESGARPVVLLNKADASDDPAQKLAEAEAVAAGVPVLVLSAETGEGLAPLKELITPGQTFAFIGSSGVGKSTLINRIAGADIQQTADVRLADDKGRHTTTRRELILLPQGGLLIDTPGMRELQLWSADEGLEDAFADIERLAAQCHFSDCTHTSEIKCAVLAALESGELAEARYRSYLKLQKELAYLETTQAKDPHLARKRRDKAIHKKYRKIKHRRTQEEKGLLP